MKDCSLSRTLLRRGVAAPHGRSDVNLDGFHAQVPRNRHCTGLAAPAAPPGYDLPAWTQIGPKAT